MRYGRHASVCIGSYMLFSAAIRAPYVGLNVRYCFGPLRYRGLN